MATELNSETEDKLDAVLELRAIFSSVQFTIKEITSLLIEETLLKHRGNRTTSAKAVGVCIRTMRLKSGGKSNYVKKTKKTTDR